MKIETRIGEPRGTGGALSLFSAAVETRVRVVTLCSKLTNHNSRRGVKKLRNSLATSRGLLPLRASLRQPGRPRVLLTSFSRGGGPAQPTLCSAQKKFWRSGRREPRQLSTDVDRFDGFDGSLDGPMGDGRPPQTPPPGLEPASTRSNQALRTAMQAGLQN